MLTLVWPNSLDFCGIKHQSNVLICFVDDIPARNLEAKLRHKSYLKLSNGLKMAAHSQAVASEMSAKVMLKFLITGAVSQQSKNMSALSAGTIGCCPLTVKQYFPCLLKLFSDMECVTLLAS